MRHTLSLLFLLLAAAAAGLVIGRSVARPVASLGHANVEVDAGLARPIGDVRFNGVALIEVIATLKKKSGAKISVEWDELEAAGIDRLMPITLHVADLPLRRVLELLCDEAGGETVRLDTRVNDGEIILTTADDASRYAELRIYDVRDLISQTDAYRRSLGWCPATQPAGSSQTLFASNGNAASSDGTAPSDVVAVDEISRMIAELVNPESWRDAGGTVGTIHEFNGRLLINALPAAHDRIAELLQMLREGK